MWSSHVRRERALHIYMYVRLFASFCALCAYGDDAIVYFMYTQPKYVQKGFEGLMLYNLKW